MKDSILYDSFHTSYGLINLHLNMDQVLLIKGKTIIDPLNVSRELANDDPWSVKLLLHFSELLVHLENTD